MIALIALLAVICLIGGIVSLLETASFAAIGMIVIGGAVLLACAMAS